MIQLKQDYQNLKSQLINEGCEESVDEVMWNDNILIAMDVLFEDVSIDTERQIRLNLL